MKEKTSYSTWPCMALLVWLHRFVFSFVHMNEGKDLVFDMAVQHQKMNDEAVG